MKALTQTITTLEIADMMNISHWQILRKLDGTKKTKGIIQILNDNKIVVVDYFKPNTYKDDKGEIRPCYDVTKLGCDFLANKFNGEKGILFTALYVKRFHEMEESLMKKKPTQELPSTENTWITRNRDLIQLVGDKFGWEFKTVLHRVLADISSRYNIRAVNEIYKKHAGKFPKYQTDVLDYFDKLSKEATDYLEYLLNL